ncbi:MAG: MFS transporter [Bacillota bacterium]|nr:MFS transporter [Bacillota bacterium]
MKSLFKPYKGLSKEIWVLFFARVINCMGAFIFPLLTLILTTKLGLDSKTAGFLISGSGIVYMFSGVIGGKLTDLFGRKTIIVTLNLIGAGFYIAAGFMNVSIAMIPMIMAAGFFMSMSDPASSALVADITEPKTRDGAYSLFYIGINIGFAFSPTIGGLLLKNHLNLLFLIDGATAVIAMLLILFFIPETIGNASQEFGEDREMEKQVEGSTIEVLLERPILLFFALTMFGYSFVYSQWSFMFPMHVAKVFAGNGSRIFGGLVSFNAVIVLTLTPLITLLLLSKSSIKKLFYGGIMYTFGFGSLFFGKTIYSFILSAFLITVGEIIVTISSSPFIANHTPASHRGRINSILPIISGLGYTIGPALMGMVLSIISINNAWIVIAVVMVIFSFFTKILEKYENKEKETA